MAFLSDFMMAAAAFGAAIYCFVLARRLKALTRLDSGMGGAIALLSAQVDDLTRALAQARTAAGAQNESLPLLVDRAEAAGRRLELLMATMHDLPAGTRSQPSDAQGASGMVGASGTGAPPSRRAQQGTAWHDSDAHSASDHDAAGAAPAGPNHATRSGSAPLAPPRARIVRRRQPTEAV